MNKFELKLSTPDSNLNGVFSYQEVTEIPIIQNEISRLLNVKKTLKEMMNENILLPYSNFTSRRRKYKLNEFTFDFDETDFGYQVGEVEILVNDNEVHQGREKIEKLFKSLNLQKTNTDGKLIEYVKLKNPKHFSILKKFLL